MRVIAVSSKLQITRQATSKDNAKNIHLPQIRVLPGQYSVDLQMIPCQVDLVFRMCPPQRRFAWRVPTAMSVPFYARWRRRYERPFKQSTYLGMLFIATRPRHGFQR